LKSTIEATLTN